MSSKAAEQSSPLSEEHQNDDKDSQVLHEGEEPICFPRRQRFLSLSVPPMPWFGLDIGGTLSKLVYFEPSDQAEYPESVLSGEIERVKVIHRYLVTNKAYGETGVRDAHLELNNVQINGREGTIHFIRFPSCRMPNFISLTESKGFASMSSTVCATGGGAHKYADSALKSLNVKLHKFDELESLIQGIEFIAQYNPEECYYWANPLDENACKRVTWPWSGRSPKDAESTSTDGLQYPYIVVNMGSGVSVVAVYGPSNFRRVSGSSIGGGFFHGLCCLLCDCESFDEAIELAARGDNKKVDKLVRDIYGGDYELFGLPGDTVAARSGCRGVIRCEGECAIPQMEPSFGHMISPERRKEVSKEDLARAALVTVTNNIGSIAMNCARSEQIDRILFVGNFLRVNPVAAKSLSYAMDYWSGGTKKALFLQHEGYFGAVGCLEKLVVVTELRRKERVANGHATSKESSDEHSLSR